MNTVTTSSSLDTINNRKWLFDGTVLSNKKLYDGTVPSNKKLYDGTTKKGREGGGMLEGRAGKEREGTRGSRIGTVGSRAVGDNRKRARITPRRVGLKARPTPGVPAAGSPVMVSFP